MENPFQIVSRYNLPAITSVLQVGASAGQEIPMFSANGVTHAVMVEALDFPFSVLCSNCSGIANFLPVQSAVGARDGEVVKFYVSNNGGQSSSILKPAKHLSAFPHVLFDEEVSKNSFTLDSIAMSVKLANPNFPENYDLLYLDVQGAELEVLKGASRNLLNCKYIFTEVGFGGGYEKDVSYLQLAQFLSAFNYKLVSLNIDPVCGYGDAFFIRLSNS